MGYGTILSIVGGLVSAGGKGAGGYFGYESAGNSATQVRFNAENQFMELAAASRAESMAAKQQEDQMRGASERQMAAVRSAYAKSGVVGTVGTPLTMQQAQAASNEQAIQQMKQDSQFRRKLLARAQVNVMREAQMNIDALKLQAHESLIQGVFGTINSLMNVGGGSGGGSGSTASSIVGAFSSKGGS